MCHPSLTPAPKAKDHPYMPVFASCGEALALGLASGPACIAACGPVLVPSLLTERAGFRPHLRYLSAFLAARLAGYMIFAVVAWELGVLASMLPAPRLLLMGAVYVLLAGVLLWYAYSARRSCVQPCADSKLVQIGESRNRGLAGAASLGFLTGLNLCPPFVAAGIRAAQLGSIAAALLFFAAFFLGTSLWFVPFISLGCIARNQAVLTVARMAMVLIALYYLSMGIAMLLGKKTYGY
jgi:sulfite exporter TauE/SafE